MLGHLMIIDPALGSAVEEALGMVGEAERLTPARDPIDLDESPTLSLIKKAKTVPLRRHQHDTGVGDLPATRHGALAARCWSKRSNSCSISPALASFSRNSQSVVASAMLSSIASPRKRENDSRSRT